MRWVPYEISFDKQGSLIMKVVAALGEMQRYKGSRETVGG
jgi:hypothetical protein